MVSPDWEQSKQCLKANILKYFPRVIIYIICFNFFVQFMKPLIEAFLKYESIVVMNFEEPKSVDFPSFTICGCCLKRPLINDTPEAILNKELKDIYKNPVLDIFSDESYTYKDLITKCFYIKDARYSEDAIECQNIANIIESIHDGRKCFTFFSRLADGVDDKNIEQWQNMSRRQKQNRIVSYFQIEIVLKGYELFLKKFPVRNELQNADVVISMHTDGMLPIMLDSEFFQIEPKKLYEIHLNIEKISLLSSSYHTNCRHYSSNQKPRSQNECINLCALKETFRHTPCINYFAILTRDMFKYNEEFFKQNLKNEKRISFCSARTYNSYIQYVKMRRECWKRCPRDCEDEIYQVKVDRSDISRKYVNNSNINTDKSMLVIWPNREAYQTIKHESEMDIVQLVGYLGGHAHIWLGLSMIQFYDVIAKVFSKCKQLVIRYFIQ